MTCFADKMPNDRDLRTILFSWNELKQEERLNETFRGMKYVPEEFFMNNTPTFLFICFQGLLRGRWIIPFAFSPGRFLLHFG